MIPTLNETYHYFDDGKIRESRKMLVTITDIVPFDKIDKYTLGEWNEEVVEHDWLYNKETDYFVAGDLKISNNEVEKVFFVRTVDNGWFSLGDWSGKLDIDGSLNTLSNKTE